MRSRFRLIHEVYMGTNTSGGFPPCRVAIFRDSDKKQYQINVEAGHGLPKRHEEEFYADSKKEARNIAARSVRKLRSVKVCQPRFNVRRWRSGGWVVE